MVRIVAIFHASNSPMGKWDYVLATRLSGHICQRLTGNTTIKQGEQTTYIKVQLTMIVFAVHYCVQLKELMGFCCTAVSQANTLSGISTELQGSYLELYFAMTLSMNDDLWNRTTSCCFIIFSTFYVKTILKPTPKQLKSTKTCFKFWYFSHWHGLPCVQKCYLVLVTCIYYRYCKYCSIRKTKKKV